MGTEGGIDSASRGVHMQFVWKNKKKDVNLLRYEIFHNVYEKKGKIIDLSLLPPCRESLVLQSER